MGCVHIYCGDGKGKTSASLGLALRAAGRGKKVLMVRFLKTEDSGEVSALRHVPGIEVEPCGREFGFVSRMSPGQKAEAAAWYQGCFEKACEKVREGGYDVLILDEIMAKEADVASFLERRPENLEVAMTGRGPSKRLLTLADYVSEIQMVKHPFTRGVAAREGVEY